MIYEYNKTKARLRDNTSLYLAFFYDIAFFLGAVVNTVYASCPVHALIALEDLDFVHCISSQKNDLFLSKIVILICDFTNLITSFNTLIFNSVK
ncbi:hypothetical protein PMSD_22450 [Paenibacillus macquariensis subsp. defensor]|nr:hypothetical protein PMSD_22450 [Paenibacillus macquariensis subsp. defensor]